MPLFGANGGLKSDSPGTFNPLTVRVLLDMKIVTTSFYTQSSTVLQDATVTRRSLGHLRRSAGGERLWVGIGRMSEPAESALLKCPGLPKGAPWQRRLIPSTRNSTEPYRRCLQSPT